MMTSIFFDNDILPIEKFNLISLETINVVMWFQAL